MSGKRPLTVPEREALLLQPLVGVFSTLAPAGWIHSVPVHFLFRDGELWVLAERDSEKCRNVRRTGRGTLCVETATPLERRYVSVEGEVRIEEEVLLSYLEGLDSRYSRSDAAGFEDGDFDQAVMLVLQPERWIAWTDWDD